MGNKCLACIRPRTTDSPKSYYPATVHESAAFVEATPLRYSRLQQDVDVERTPSRHSQLQQDVDVDRSQLSSALSFPTYDTTGLDDDDDTDEVFITADSNFVDVSLNESSHQILHCSEYEPAPLPHPETTALEPSTSCIDQIFDQNDTNSIINDVPEQTKTSDDKELCEEADVMKADQGVICEEIVDSKKGIQDNSEENKDKKFIVSNIDEEKMDIIIDDELNEDSDCLKTIDTNIDEKDENVEITNDIPKSINVDESNWNEFKADFRLPHIPPRRQRSNKLEKENKPIIVNSVGLQRTPKKVTFMTDVNANSSPDLMIPESPTIRPMPTPMRKIAFSMVNVADSPTDIEALCNEDGRPSREFWDSYVTPQSRLKKYRIF